MSAPLEHAMLLLRTARADLMAAEDILAAGRVPETACFHCQQAVEKSLKALLAADEMPYPRTHDLRLLLELVRPLSGDVPPGPTEVLALSQYAVELRYEEGPELGPAEGSHALEVARQVLHFVHHTLAERTSPPEADTEQPDPGTKHDD